VGTEGAEGVEGAAGVVGAGAGAGLGWVDIGFAGVTVGVFADEGQGSVCANMASATKACRNGLIVKLNPAIESVLGAAPGHVTLVGGGVLAGAWVMSHDKGPQHPPVILVPSVV
jgi:hypothetical protein